jgi:hypothetical protein
VRRCILGSCPTLDVLEATNLSQTPMGWKGKELG